MNPLQGTGPEPCPSQLTLVADMCFPFALSCLAIQGIPSPWLQPPSHRLRRHSTSRTVCLFHGPKQPRPVGDAAYSPGGICLPHPPSMFFLLWALPQALNCNHQGFRNCQLVPLVL